MQAFSIQEEPLRSGMWRARRLGQQAVEALIAEAELTPKPALVDGRGSGAHRDLTLDAMHRSARAIGPYFEQMAVLAKDAFPSRQLREELAATGRSAEQAMLQATSGSNAHRGAIWALGLLCASAAMGGAVRRGAAIAEDAARIARFPDRSAPVPVSHGHVIARRYGVGGARSEAQNGFPHVMDVGIPALRASRAQGHAERFARLDALLAIMNRLDDTCLLYRGGVAALDAAKRGAGAVLAAGGAATADGIQLLLQLDKELIVRNASPGGSADLLAATIFLDAVEREEEDSHD